MMKRYLFYTVLSVLAVLTGCRNEEDWGVKQSNGSYKIKAQIEKNVLPDSRTTINENHQVLWVENDQIGIYGNKGTANLPFSLISEADKTEGTFQGELQSGEEVLYAYHPYQETALLNGKSMEITLPSQYTYTGNSNVPMIGVKNEDGTFAFKHLCGLMQVTFRNIPSKTAQFIIVSEGKNPANISGTAVVENVDTPNTTLAIKEGRQASQTITYRINSTDFIEEGLTFHVPLPVGVYEKLSVMLKDESNNIFFQKSISNATIKRAVILSMPILDCENNISYVLNEQTMQLNKQDENYIESVTKEGDETSGINKIIYSLDIPTNRLPTIGQILLCNEVTEKFPSGFLGKVTSIEKTNNGYKVHTQPATLNEAFDQLHINQTFDLIPTESNTPQSRAELLPDEDGYYTFEKTFEVSSDPNVEEYHYRGEANLGFKLYVRIDINKNTPPMAVMTLQSKVESELNFGLKLQGEMNKRYPIGTELSFTAIPGGIVITPSLQLYFILNAKGEIGFDTTINLNKQTVNGIEYKNDMWQAGGSNVGEDGLFGWGLTDSTRVTLEGNAFAGIGLDMSIQLFNNNNLQVGIEPKLGLEASASMSFDMSISEGTDLYEELKDAHVKSGLKVQTDALASTNIFDGSDPWEKTIHEDTYLEKIHYLFPLFENPAVKTSSENHSAVVTYDVNRDLLFHSNIGMTLYKEDQWMQDIDEEDYRWAAEYANPLMGAFEELEADANYKAVPYVMWGNSIRIYAQPEQPFMLKDGEDPAPETPLIVTTGKSTDVTKTSATLSGSLANMQPDEIYTYGFIYSVNKNPVVDDGTKVEVSTMQEDRSFTVTLSALEENMTYYWRAYACDGSGNYTYGDIEILATIEISPEEQNERDILIAFYKATGGDNWINNTNWCTAAPLKDWFGVTVNYPEGYVETITLESNHLVGSADLRGLKGLIFLNLNSGHNNNHNLTSINLSGLKNLSGIELDYNQLQSLDITGCDNLMHLSCEENQLSILNVTGFENLKALYCSGNQLTSLDLSASTKLEDLNCNYNLLTSLDISASMELRSLYCIDNQLTSLDVSGRGKLKFLSASDNPLTELNIDGCTNLIRFDCGGPGAYLPNLDVSKYVNLTSLGIGSCGLTDLDVSTLVNLTSLGCVDNKLTDLDVSNLKNLVILSCSNNQLTHLNVSMLERLTTLRCDINQLTSLDVSMLGKLHTLYCENNKLSELKLSPATIILSCSDNLLTELDISQQPSNFSLWGDNNNLKVVYLSISQSQKPLEQMFHLWGEQNFDLYRGSSHINGYQYPKFIYK